MGSVRAEREGSYSLPLSTDDKSINYNCGTGLQFCYLATRPAPKLLANSLCVYTSLPALRFRKSLAVIVRAGTVLRKLIEHKRLSMLKDILEYLCLWEKSYKVESLMLVIDRLKKSRTENVRLYDRILKSFLVNNHIC